MGWFSKGSSSPAPMPEMPQSTGGGEIEAMLGMMQGMMGGMMEGMMGQMQAMQQANQTMLDAQFNLPEAPPVSRVPEVDWTERQNQLAQMARADYNLDQTRRKSRTDTILTSPLLDEEDAITTGSVLAGTGSN